MEHFQQCQFHLKIMNELGAELYEDAVASEEENFIVNGKVNIFLADSGFDLYFCEDTTVPAGTTVLVGLGVSVEAKYYSTQFGYLLGLDACGWTRPNSGSCLHLEPPYAPAGAGGWSFITIGFLRHYMRMTAKCLL